MRLRLIKFFFSEQSTIQTPIQVKKFYREASVEKIHQADSQLHQWAVKLDGKTVKTPSKHLLAVPTPQLAQFIAHEFNMQKEFIRSSTMPLLTMAKHAIEMDQDERIREFVERAIVNYLERDTLLYREEVGSKLCLKQTEKLDPIVKQFNERYSMQLKLNYGLEVNSLRVQDKLRIEGLITPLNNWQLVSLDQLVDNLKSCILGVSLWDNQIEVEKAVELSRMEEDFQIEQYGKVEGHHDYDENTILMHVTSAKLFAQLIQSQTIIY